MCPQSTLFPVTFSHFLGIAIKIPFLGETATALRHTSLALVSSHKAAKVNAPMECRGEISIAIVVSALAPLTSCDTFLLLSLSYVSLKRQYQHTRSFKNDQRTRDRWNAE